MDPLDQPAEGIARGLSRRQVLHRVGGGLAGGLIASLGLASGRSDGSTQASFISLRAAMAQIGGCDPSHGIRAMLPVYGPVISLRDVLSRFYHP